MYDLNTIKDYLDTMYTGQTIIQFDELKSTSAKAKSIFSTCPHGTVVLSEHQSNCTVRLGREWHSKPDKNIYMSIILKPQPESCILSKYEAVLSSSVLRTVNSLSDIFMFKTKWPNDILADGKKIASVYCEIVKIKNKTEGIISSMFINVNSDESDLDEEIKKISTSLKIKLQHEINREMLIGSIINNFEIYHEEMLSNDDINDAIKNCINNSMLAGKNIMINKPGKKTTREVTVKGMDADGNLLVLNDKGNEEIIYSGEIILRYEEKS